MAAHFFDSSALVKRYVSESGSARVISLADAAAGNQIYMAHTSVVEVTAALARRVREGSLTIAEGHALRGTFLFDVGSEYHLIGLTEDVVHHAVSLTQHYPLRAADAIQLATALNVNDDRAAHGLSPLVVTCSDQSLLKAAMAEGLAIEDPTAHAP